MVLLFARSNSKCSVATGNVFLIHVARPAVRFARRIGVAVLFAVLGGTKWSWVVDFVIANTLPRLAGC